MAVFISARLASYQLCFLILQLFLYRCKGNRLNVLMVIVDDLRPETSSYTTREEGSFTPNLDAFADESLQFQKAYVQVPLCGPSRASLFTGRTPESMHYYFHNLEDVRDEAIVRQSPTITLPLFFRAKGYTTIGIGKVFHSGENLRSDFDIAKITSTDTCPCQGSGCPSFECAVKSDASLPDQTALDFALTQIDALKQNPGNPFFMTVGFRKPHLPYRVPIRHKRKIKSIFPEGVPCAESKERSRKDSLSNYYCASIDKFANAHSEGSSTQLNSPVFSLDLQQDIRSGYYSAVSWADEAVGTLLQKLKTSGFYDKTLVVILSDNGWLLGEHGNWCKNSAFELSNRIPLWIRHPEGRKGEMENQIVSLVSIYPTIAELSGVSMTSDLRNKMHGQSFASLVSFQDQFGIEEKRKRIRPYAFSVVARCFDRSTELLVTCERKDQINVLGYSVRSEEWRYTEWRTFQTDVPYANSFLLERELYDHSQDDGTDPDESELKNVAKEAASNNVVTILSGVLRSQYGCQTDSCRRSVEFETLSPTPSPTLSPTPSPTVEVTAPAAFDKTESPTTSKTLSPVVTPQPTGTFNGFVNKADNDSTQAVSIVFVLLVAMSASIFVVRFYRNAALQAATKPETDT